VIDVLHDVLAADPRVAYALLFGSTARETNHTHSDVDVAIAGVNHERFDTFAVGEITSRLEAATCRPVHVVMLDEAPPGLAYRIFRDGKAIFIRDAAAFKSRLARAILEYLDFKPVEDLFTRGVLRERHGR